MRVEVAEIKRRLDDSERDRRELWRSNGSTDRAVERMHERQDNFQDDVSELKTGLSNLDSKFSKRMAWVTAALFTLAVAILSAATMVLVAIK